MPLYEYKCGSCGQVFEIIQKFSDTPLTVHETCGGTVERLISTSALQFKGSGWYVNDYGKGNSKEPKPKHDASNGGGKSDSGSKGDKSNGSKAASESSGKSESSSKTDSQQAASTPSSKSDK
jgi:putative FmdB family regulatory protein